MTGKKLTHYRILEELGRGGMGIVYKAEDTKLDRTVAIKVLPPAALASEDDRSRFYREAKAAAALHHPNIASVFEIDEAVPEGRSDDDRRPFIAMEFIDGDTLQDRLRNKPMRINDARDMAIQIASALDVAHSKNIVHRDIKSGNIMVAADGTAKILDFGLAQTAHSTKLTQMGSTVGTIAYMSPEQARGEEVDLRTDLWSLGVVLYEMISGQYPFPGDYEQAVVYSILNNEPEPLTAVRTGVPMQLEWIANKLLAKDAKDRYQTAKDLIVDLRNVETDSAKTTTLFAAISQQNITPASPKNARSWPLIAGALLLGAGLTAAGFFLSKPEPPTEPLTRVEITIPELLSIRFPTVSPDGKYMAFIGNDVDDRDGVFLRDMATGETRYIENSAVVGNRELGFSPDGQRLAFNADFNGGLFVSVVPNGIPERVTDFGRFAVWEDNNTVIMSDDKPGGGESYRVNIETRETVQIDIPNPNLKEGFGNVIKTMIPGTQRFFGHQIVRFTGGNVGSNSAIITLDGSTGDVDIIERNAINPHYIGDGFLTYQLGDDNGRIVVRRVNTKTGQFEGTPTDALTSGETAVWSRYTVTPSGDLIYIPESLNFVGRNNSLWLANIETKEKWEISSNLPDGFQTAFPSFSPDGDLIAFNVDDGNRGNIYIYNRRTEEQIQYTFSGRHGGGTFDRDSETLYYTKLKEGEAVPSIYRRNVNVTQAEEHIYSGAVMPSIAPDGSYFAATGIPPTHENNLIKINVDEAVAGDTDSFTVEPMLPDSSQGMMASFSPDGRYIAYQDPNLNFDLGPLWVASVDGSIVLEIPGIQGIYPVWSSDGRYIYYSTYSHIFRVPVRINPNFNIIGQPEWVVSAGDLNGFDVARDGRTIAISSWTVEFGRGREGQHRIVWLQNWKDELNRTFDRD